MELLKTLSELPGAPGREEKVRDYILEQIKPHVDSWEIDALGNLICHKASKTQDTSKVMIACHMDEIGFYVRHIDDSGFIRVLPVGGFDTRNLFARRVRIQTRDGKELFGNLNPAGRPVHVATPEEKTKIPKVHEFFVDTGLDGADVKKQVRPGDPVTLVQEFSAIGNLWSGKCLDNRAACWVGIKLLQSLKAPKQNLYVVFTVQEEIGLRGAITSGYGINPDVGIAIDTTLAIDTPGIAEDEQITRLGKGTAIKILDSYSVSHKELVDEFIALAEAHEIKHQFELLPLGGTDAAALQRSRAGCRAIALSIPTRYIHTVTETLHKDDLYATVDLLTKYVES